MFSQVLNHKYLIFIVFLSFYFLPGFGQLSVFAQDATLLAQDLKDYESSSFKNSKWDELVKKGMTDFHDEKYESALDNLYKAFNKGCRSPIVLFQMALIYEDQSLFYSALEYYKLAEKEFSKSNQNHRYSKTFAENYGRALYNAGKKDEAFPILKKAAKSTKNYWILKMLGMLSTEKADTLNATMYFEMAVRIDGVPREELLYCYFMLARLFVGQGELDGALRNYAKVAELDPQNAEAVAFVNQYKQKQQETIKKEKDNKDFNLFKKLLEDQ